jgi:hypothetical protein
MKKERAVDSTKGRADVNPVRYKGDVLVQVWMDSRVLATLSQWLDKSDNYMRFMSEVVNDSMSMLCDHLVDVGEVNMIDDTVHARQLLERKYRVNLNPSDRGRRNRQHNVLLTEKRKQIGIVSGVDVDQPMRKPLMVSPEELARLVAIAESYNPEQGEQSELKDKAIQAAKESGMVVSDSDE